MLVCEGSVTTLWAWASVKTRPCAARRSRTGVVTSAVAGEPQRVGAQGVDGDQDDVGTLGARRRPRQKARQAARSPKKRTRQGPGSTPGTLQPPERRPWPAEPRASGAASGYIDFRNSRASSACAFFGSISRSFWKSVLASAILFRLR